MDYTKWKGLRRYRGTLAIQLLVHAVVESHGLHGLRERPTESFADGAARFFKAGHTLVSTVPLGHIVEHENPIFGAFLTTFQGYKMCAALAHKNAQHFDAAPILLARFFFVARSSWKVDKSSAEKGKDAQRAPGFPVLF